MPSQTSQTSQTSQEIRSLKKIQNLYCVVPLNNDNEMLLTIKLTITVVIPKNDSATNDAFDADNAYDITTSITPHDNDNNCL